MLSRYLTGYILVAVVVFALGGLPTPGVAAPSDTDNARVLRLYFQVQQLKDRIRHLQGEIQALKHRVAQNRKLQKRNYQSLLKRLEGGSETSPGTAAQSGTRQQETKAAQAGTKTGTKTGKQPAGSPGSPSGSPSGGQSPASGNQPESSGSSLHEQYMAAFDILKKGKYDKAASAFQQFAQQHPQTSLTDNAYYWRGEALYVQQKYEKARKAFVKVVNNFPKSAKVPGSLYKLAILDIRNGHTDNAKAVLNRIVEQYGGSRAARLAKDKLEQLGS